MLLIAILLGAAPSAYAGDIATWVDSDGVTHFGNPQFAPPDAHAVEVGPANGMDVPEAPRTTSRGGPRMVLLEKKPNRELVGWRGYEWNVQRRGHR